jgi:hypothetical protein
MQVRVLNEEGLAEYRVFLSALRAKPTLDAPFHLLADGKFSEPFEVEVEVEQRDFDTPFAWLYAVSSGT